MTSKIAKTAIIHPNVQMGEHCIVEDFCIVGQPLADGTAPPTVIGDHCHLRAMTIIYAGNNIGHHFQTGNKANVREHNDIGNYVSIGTMSVVEHHVQIEDSVRIHTCAFVPEYSVLKKESWVGPHVVMTNAKYPATSDAKKNLKGPTVEMGAVIGANSTLSPGIEIGQKSLVGSGSNVTKSVPPDSIFLNPSAIQIKKRDFINSKGTKG